MRAAGNSKSGSSSSTPSPRSGYPDGEREPNSVVAQQSLAHLQQQQYLQQQQHYQRQLEQQQQHRYHQQQQPPQHYQQRLAYQQQLFAQQQFAYQQQQQLPYVQQRQPHLYRQHQQHVTYQADPQLAYQQLRREQHPQQQSSTQQQHYAQRQQGFQQHFPHEGLHVRRSHPEQRQVGPQQRPSSLPARGPLSRHQRKQQQPHRRRQQHQSSLQHQDEDLVMHPVCPAGGSNTDGMEAEGVASHYHYYEEPELRSRKDICSTAAAVLGLGRVTGVFLFVFAATVAAAIVFETAGPVAHEYYISCHGSNVAVSHKLFLVFLLLQTFLIVVHWPLTAASSAAVAAAVPHHRPHYQTAGRVRQHTQQHYYQGQLQEAEEEDEEEHQNEPHTQPQDQKRVSQRSLHKKTAAHSSPISGFSLLSVSDCGSACVSNGRRSSLAWHTGRGGSVATETPAAAAESAAHEAKGDVTAPHGQPAATCSSSENCSALPSLFSLTSPTVPLNAPMKQSSDTPRATAAPPATLPVTTAPAAPARAAAAPGLPKAASAAAAPAQRAAARAGRAAAAAPGAADASATLATACRPAFESCGYGERLRIYSRCCQDEQQLRPSLKFVSVAVCASGPPDALQRETGAAEEAPTYASRGSAAAAARRGGGGGAASPTRATAAGTAAEFAPPTPESAPLVEEKFVNGVEPHARRRTLLRTGDKERETADDECYYAGEGGAARVRGSSRGSGVRTARLILDSIVQGNNSSSSREGYIPACDEICGGSGDEEEVEEEEGQGAAEIARGRSLRYLPSSSLGPQRQQPEQQQEGQQGSSSRTSSTKSPSSLAADETAVASLAGTAAAEKGAGTRAAAAASATDDTAMSGGTEAAAAAQTDKGHRGGHESTVLRVVVTAAAEGAGYATTPAGASGERIEIYWRPYGVDWNSVWTATTFFIYALGFYAAVLGWRVYGGSAANYTTWSTCSHLDFPTFGADLPLMHSVVSDFTFVEVFGACAAHLLLVRKYLDPYRLSSYCLIFPLLLRAAYRPLVKIIFVTQLLLQAALYVVLAWNLLVCWTTGYGTPMQILSAVMLASVTLWVFSVLSHVLQADRMNPPLRPTLVYHWLWWMISLGIIWLCGFLFYFSVYGTYSTPFLLLHAFSWLLFLVLTYCRLPAIFPYWTSGSEDDYERQRPPLAAVGNPLPPPPAAAPHTGAELLPLSPHVQLAAATPAGRKARPGFSADKHAAAKVSGYFHPAVAAPYAAVAAP